MKLPNLVFKQRCLSNGLNMGGVQAKYKDWSVILGPGSYGGDEGLYEVMGPGFDDGSGVEGFLTLPEVMERIAKWEEDHNA